jgi:hypothetical protein
MYVYLGNYYILTAGDISGRRGRVSNVNVLFSVTYRVKQFGSKKVKLNGEIRVLHNEPKCIRKYLVPIVQLLAGHDTRNGKLTIW